MSKHISLIGSIYKIISKVLSNRLKNRFWIRQCLLVRMLLWKKDILESALVANEVANLERRNMTRALYVSWILRKLTIM